MSPQLLMLLAGFGVQRAWDLVLWLSGLGAQRRGSLPRRVSRALRRDYDGLVDDEQRSRLEAWLTTAGWEPLLTGGATDDGDAVVEAVSEVLTAGGAHPTDGEDTRRRAAAVLTVIWSVLVERVSPAELFAIETELRRRQDQRSIDTRLRRIVDDLDMYSDEPSVIEQVAQLRVAVEQLAEKRELQDRLVPPRSRLSDARLAGPGQLLSPRYGLVSFLYRQREMKQLVYWALGPDPSSVAVVTGPAGSGKTRLAVELLALLIDTHDWIGGLLVEGSLAGVERGALQRPALLVVDYAEARAGDAIEALRWSAARSDTEPVRVLLLMRNPQSPQDPLNRFRFTSDEVDATLERARVLRLDAGEWDDLMRRKFAETAEGNFASALGVTANPPAQIDPKLRTPLQLSIAALLAVRGGSGIPQAAGDELDALLRHEQRYWEATATGAGVDEPAETLMTCVAALTLTADAIADTAGLIAAVQLVDELSEAEPARLRRIARWLRLSYPGEEGAFVSRVVPDALAERLISVAALQ